MRVTEENWLDVLRVETGKSSNQAVANAVGVSRTAISLALAGKYRGQTDLLRDKIIAHFSGDVDCPHLGTSIALAECRGFQGAPLPMSCPNELRHWHACRQCEHFMGDEGLVA